MFHCWARDVPNLVVSWHGISLEALHSRIYQDLTRGEDERMSPASNHSLAQSVYRVLSEVHFFRSYVHHVAISDTTGEMLRDVYQIPNRRVHVILNGVDEAQFEPDAALGRAFREDLRLPKGANLVLGVSGRLVKGADLSKIHAFKIYTHGAWAVTMDIIIIQAVDHKTGTLDRIVRAPSVPSSINHTGTQQGYTGSSAMI
ncbi:hypothetical protein OsJ_27456 [Oryza sativa Japonica Group]|uniref:Glycosyltransferase subfamily 4-like N-terminal domain-containing protein n=1 Tax=Oryza sativa subsp. japonica TaxID=39947 RepID=B9G141_ORYSJ|nr:hypothetical protein OsJ_27456 [Oryza sativa Japonica Group]